MQKHRENSSSYPISIFNMGDFFQMFVISQSTEIMIVSNFWLRVYTQSILNAFSVAREFIFATLVRCCLSHRGSKE